MDAITEKGRVPAVAWSYPEPLREGEPVEGLLCFFQERQEVEVEVDGVVIESWPTIYARTAWLRADWVIRAERV